MINFFILAGFFCIAQTHQNFICPAPNGIFPDFASTGCTQFWRCLNCISIKATCAHGQQFDYNRTQCDQDANVQCNDQRRSFQPLPGSPQCRILSFNTEFPTQYIPGFFGQGGPQFIPVQPKQDQFVIINLPTINPPINRQQCIAIQNQINAFFAQVIQLASGQRCPSLQYPLPILIIQC